MKQNAPFDIPELGVKKGQLISVANAFTDASRDFRLEVLVPTLQRTVWYMYDSKFEAQEQGWEV